jgi:uncharacterized membrane protein YkoI
MGDKYRTGMKRVLPCTFLALLTGLAAQAAPASAQSYAPRGEQDQARKQLLDGEVMPFRLIKRRVEQRMGDGASFVGVAPSPREGVYRMQFLRKDGVVIWVDVDGKSGEIIARTK